MNNNENRYVDSTMDNKEHGSSFESDDELRPFHGEERFASIAEKYHASEALNEKELDQIADLYIDVIKTILRSFDAEDSKIDEYVGNDGELIFDVLNPDLAVLIGRYGKTLDAFQTIVNSIAQHKLGFRYRTIIDVESYKSRQNEKIEAIAKNAAKKAIATNAPVHLKPMSAYERRIVHITLRAIEGVDTISDAEEPKRHVVILPHSLTSDE